MKTAHLVGMLLVPLLVDSCEWDGFQADLSIGPFGEETRKVLLLYEAGFNSLGSDIRNNIETLKEGYLPGNRRNDDILLILSHVTESGWNYTRETSPVLLRMYRSCEGTVVDTLESWPVGTSTANAAMVNEVFTRVRDLFPASGYGAVLSSHASGWLPEGYYSNPKLYEDDDRSSGGNSIIWYSPVRRTFGQEYYSSGAQSEEIELHDLAAAIPYHLDYILFDACLMASVEVAWALKDVCDYLIAAPTETPGPGFDYASLVQSLLKSTVPDFVAVCKDFYTKYTTGTYSYFGACISLIDCREMDELAHVCRELFSRYRDDISQVPADTIQTYDQIAGPKHYCVFFDLFDLIRAAGADHEELDRLRTVLAKVVVYENHSEETTYSPSLIRCCGLSMYLPAYPDHRKDAWHGTAFLDGFYRQNISWNVATALVL